MKRAEVKKDVRPCICLYIDSIFTWIVTRPCGLLGINANVSELGRFFVKICKQNVICIIEINQLDNNRMYVKQHIAMHLLAMIITIKIVIQNSHDIHMDRPPIHNLQNNRYVNNNIVHIVLTTFLSLSSTF